MKGQWGRFGAFVGTVAVISTVATRKSNSAKTIEAVGDIFSTSLAAAMGETEGARIARLEQEARDARIQQGLHGDISHLVKQRQKSGTNSVNIQSGGDVTIRGLSNVTISDQRIPSYLVDYYLTPKEPCTSRLDRLRAWCAVPTWYYFDEMEFANAVYGRIPDTWSDVEEFANIVAEIRENL